MKTKLVMGLLFPFIFTGCGLFRKSTKEKVIAEKKLPFLAQLEKELLLLPAVQGKGHGKMQVNQTQNRATLSFYFQKDQFLFVRATLFSIEGARALITFDSTIILNRVEKTAILANTKKFLDSLGIPLSFKEMEGLLFGIPPLSWFSQVKQKGKLYFEGEIMPQIKARFHLDANCYHLAQIELIAGDKKANIYFQNYQVYQQAYIPQYIRIELELKGKPKNYVEIDKINVKPLSENFEVPKISIPKSYEVIRY